MKFTKILLILPLILCSSCQNAGNKNALRLYAKTLEKEVLRDKIIEKYGNPQEKWLDKRKNQVFSYSYSKPKYNWSSFFLLPLSPTKFYNYEVILTFNGQNQLIDSRKFLDQMMVKPWTICESSITNCDLGCKKIDRK